MRFKNSIAAAALVLGTSLLASTSFAAPITTGTLGMSFTYQAENAAGTNVALGSATAIDFSTQNVGAPSTANTGSFLVTQVTGGFATAGLTVGLIGTIHDLIFSPFAAINDFFTVGGVTFDLSSILVTTQNDSVLALTGSGLFQEGTPDVTAGVWSVSFQTDGVHATGEFTWSANATPVAEPATLALLGMGLLGLGAIRRRSAKA